MRLKRHTPISHSDYAARVLMMAAVDSGAPVEMVWQRAVEIDVAPKALIRAQGALAIVERDGRFVLPDNVILFNAHRLLRQRANLVPGNAA
jgi:hypothetical protein